MRNGNKASNRGWLEEIKAQGVNVPVLDDVPELLPDAKWLYTAFEMLSARRYHIDGRPQPIQISEIAAYAEFEEIHDKTMRDDLLHMVSVLDAIYITHFARKKPPEQPKTLPIRGRGGRK